MVDEILSKNESLKLTKSMVSYLKILENAIPENLRNNFYKNLETLKLDFQSHDGIGKHNPKTNTITFDSKKTVKELQKLNLSSKEVLKSLEQILLHEFVHMASCNYDEKEDIFTYGVEKKGAPINEGLNEGLTELISFLIVRPKYLPLTNYVVEMGIAYQLTLILGLDTIIETYFSGTGTKLMEDGLNSLSGESNNSKELLKQIEMTYMSKDGDFETNSLYETQRILLDYLSEKLKKINNEEEKEAIINLYSTSLITTDKLKKIVSNSEMYTDIDKNEKQFNKIINQYQNQKTDKTKK